MLRTTLSRVSNTLSRLRETNTFTRQFSTTLNTHATKGAPAAPSAAPTGPRILVATIRLRIPAQQASTKEPVGPALGQYGIPAGDFCTRFNTGTEKYITGTPVDATLLYYKDKKYDIVLDLPDLSRSIIAACGVPKASRRPTKLAPVDPHYPVITSRMLWEVLNYACNMRGTKLTPGVFKKAKDSLKAMGIYYVNETLDV
jgi:ribosomal protein L11